jgi:HAD superfamily hydrolase (TIGR01509 family)
MKNKVIMFDMDGVLIDDRLKTEAYVETFRKIGVEVDFELLRECENNRDNVVKNLLMENVLAYSYEEFIDMESIIYKRLVEKKGIDCIDHAENILKKLKDKGYKLILTSQSRHVDFILKKTNLTKYFDFIVPRRNIENIKPHPDIYNYAKNLMNLGNDECIVVEDTKKGIESAKRSGIEEIILFKPNEEKFNENLWKYKPDFVYGSLIEILNHILFKL